MAVRKNVTTWQELAGQNAFSDPLPILLAISNHTLMTPETHGTTKGAIG